MVSLLFYKSPMNKLETWRNSLGRVSPRKHAAMSTYGRRPLKAARAEVPSNTRRLKAILFSRRHDMEDEEVEVKWLVRA